MCRLLDDTPFDQGALLEPLSVALHAVRRSQLPRSASVLVLGAGAIGSLCAAVCKTKGAWKVKIADTQRGRVVSAIENSFADDGLVVSTNKDGNLEERLQTAKDAAEKACHDKDIEGFDVVFECTGVEASTQMAIYVRLDR